MNFISELFGYPLGWIMWLCYKVVTNYGIALIIFTLIAKLLMLPMAIKQQKSMIKMQLIKPKMEEIQKKYAKDPQKQQEATMELYKKEGYSPFSGCLPLLIQFPILFGLINVIYNPLTHIVRLPADVITKATEILTSLEIKTSAYSPQIGVISAVNDPTTAGAFEALGADVIEKIQSFDLTFLGMNLGAVPGWTFPLILIPIISGLTSLGLSLFSQKTGTAAAEAGTQQQGGGMMKGMMYIMPVISLIFTTQVPIGVGLYWIFSNVFSFLQTIFLHKKFNVRKIVEQMRLEEEEQKRIQKEKKAELQKKIAEGAELSKEEKAQTMTAKEINRQKLAEARRRDAEKYGEEYVEVTDEDLI